MRSSSTQAPVIGVPFEAKAFSPCGEPPQLFDSAPIFMHRPIAESSGCCICTGTSSAVHILNGTEVGSEPQHLSPPGMGAWQFACTGSLAL